MSRKPSTTGMRAPSIARIPSSASLAMPPPSKVPARPPSVMSTSAASSKVVEDSSGSRPSSPRRNGARKMNGSASGKPRSDGPNENGEINIQVVVRCRGRSTQEIAQGSPIITNTSGALSKAITIETTPSASASAITSLTTPSAYGGSNAPLSKTYGFDRVFGPEADQTMVYREVVESMLDEVLAGYNCTIFAYGQTGTGKTYTMQGDLALTPLQMPSSEAGIIPRVLHRLFALLESGGSTDYSVKCSYVELYNEELRDLLASEYVPPNSGMQGQMALSANTGGGGGLKIYEDQKGRGVNIQGLEETGVKNVKEGLALLLKGSQRRQVAETKMNSESSRSHSIFSLTVHVKEPSLLTGGEDLLKVGKLNLVDLAGSEAIGRSGAENKRAREAGMINQSLLTLGRVISALVEKSSHIPYRESKLTRLLQDSLGGRTKTCIVATVSPTRSNMEETLSTLDYAIRARSIRNKPEINQHLSKTGLLKDYLGDIERLKAELQATREKNGIYIPEEEWRNMSENAAKEKLDYEEAKIKAGSIAVELSTRKAEFEEISRQMLSTTADLEAAREKEKEMDALMEVFKTELVEKEKRLEEERLVAEAFERGEERVNKVAEGLKSTAQKSVKDVGGLFDKLSRKAKVLGSNTDAATRFGSDLQGLSSDLRNGLQSLQNTQAGFGTDLKSELENYAMKGQESSRRDMAALESTMSSIDQLARTLSQSISLTKEESCLASSAILAVKGEVQTSVREWARGVSERSTSMVDELLEHQQEHLTMVGSVLESTADLVDAVISTARDHLAAEAESSRKARDLANNAATAEIRRLAAQNQLLSSLLLTERAKSQKLQSDLIANFTQMMNKFTSSQDESLSAAISQVQSENQGAVGDMELYVQGFRGVVDKSERKMRHYGDELMMGEETAGKQREAGQSALDEVTNGMRGRLTEYSRVIAHEAREHVDVVDDFCDRLASSAADVETRASARADAQTTSLANMSAHVQETYVSSKKRISTSAENIHTISSSLLASHASSSTTFQTTFANSQASLTSILEKTSHFLSEGLLEDSPTGSTPRKRNWNVPTSWERTEPRQVLLELHRKKKAMEDNDVTAEMPSLPSSGSIASLADKEDIVEPVKMIPVARGKMGKPQYQEKVTLSVLGERVGMNVQRARSK
ncbi:kinesin family member 11, partial [Tremellales sp. Uapishka_1]